MLPQFFAGEDDIPYALRRGSDEFDFGYALTVHKAQGSQWDDVVLFDEASPFASIATDGSIPASPGPRGG